jgi:superfamily II DNA/RNA helicase
MATDADSDFSYLPEWIIHGLSHGMNIKKWLPIQSMVIPAVLNATKTHDYVIHAPTGSGKTLAYLLPILKLISKRRAIALKALIIVPTKDLMNQVLEVLSTLLSFQTVDDNNIPTIVVSSLREKQSGRIDILVMTSGQLSEWILESNFNELDQTKRETFRSLEYLVLDEVDQLLELDKNDPFLERLLELISTSKQEPWIKSSINDTSLEHIINWSSFCPSLVKLCFSATNSKKYALPDSLSEHYVIVPHHEDKPVAFLSLLQKFPNIKTGLIFTSSVKSIPAVQEKLSYFCRKNQSTQGLDNVHIDCLFPHNNSSIDIDRRMAILNRLKDSSAGKYFVVCVDGASRGLDIPDLDCVVNYDLPMDIKSHVHRVGRTARAGKPGDAFTLISPFQQSLFQEIMKKVDRGDKSIQRLPWESLIR